MMTVKRQKLFFIGTALTGAMLVQGGMQMKQSSDQAEEAEEQNRQQVKAMNRIAKAAESNPAVAQQFLATKQASDTTSKSLFSQKSFAANSKFVENAVGFAKDMGRFAWGKKKEIASGLLSGAAIGAAAYGADKFITHDIKKNNLPIGPNAVPSQRQYAAPNSSVLSDYAKRAWKFGKGVVKDHWKGAALMGVGFGAGMPLASYAAEKANAKDQIASTQQSIPQQREYATPTSIWKGIKRGWDVFKSHPGQSTIDGVTKVLGGGRTARQGMVNDIANLGKESGNKWTQKTAEWLGNHKKTAGVAAGAMGLGIMSAGFNNGEKITKGAIGAVDKNAFAYEKSKEQQIK